MILKLAWIEQEGAGYHWHEARPSRSFRLSVHNTREYGKGWTTWLLIGCGLGGTPEVCMLRGDLLGEDRFEEAKVLAEDALLLTAQAIIDRMGS